MKSLPNANCPHGRTRPGLDMKRETEKGLTLVRTQTIVKEEIAGDSGFGSGGLRGEKAPHSATIDYSP
jgi:hypothetical protein